MGIEKKYTVDKIGIDDMGYVNDMGCEESGLLKTTI